MPISSIMFPPMEAKSKLSEEEQQSASYNLAQDKREAAESGKTKTPFSSGDLDTRILGAAGAKKKDNKNSKKDKNNDLGNEINGKSTKGDLGALINRQKTKKKKEFIKTYKRKKHVSQITRRKAEFLCGSWIAAFTGVGIPETWFALHLHIIGEIFFPSMTFRLGEEWLIAGYLDEILPKNLQESFTKKARSKEILIIILFDFALFVLFLILLIILLVIILNVLRPILILKGVYDWTTGLL